MTRQLGGHARDRIEVLDRIVERPALEQGLVHVSLRPAEQDGVAVRRGAHDGGGTERGAAATDVLDHHRAEQRFQLVRQWTAHEIVGAARRKGDNQPNWPRRIALRHCGARRSWPRRRRAAEQRDELAAPHVDHGASPPRQSAARSACHRAAGEFLSTGLNCSEWGCRWHPLSSGRGPLWVKLGHSECRVQCPGLPESGHPYSVRPVSDGECLHNQVRDRIGL